MASFFDTNSTPLAVSCSTSSSRSRVLRANRLMDSTITVSPARTKDSIRFNASPFDKMKHSFFTVNSENISVGGCESLLVLNYEKVLRAYLKTKASYTSLADGELKVLIHGKKADEKLRIAVKNNEVTVEKFDGDVEIEFSHSEATRAFLSNFSFEREQLNGAAQQWFPLPAFIFSVDQM